MNHAARFVTLLCLIPVVRLSFGVELGPADGRDLAPNDLNRIMVGSTAPEFSLQASDGTVFSLREAASGSNVMLVFYRGVW